MSQKEKKEEIFIKFLHFIESTGSKNFEVSEEFQWKPVFLRKFLEEETGNVEEMLKSVGEFTGNIEDKTNKIIKYHFERYIVSIELTSKNEFIGITEITLNKDFRSFEEKIRTDKIFNLEEFNFEEKDI